MKQDTVAFSRIKKGSFFRKPGGKALWQKIDSNSGQVVAGYGLGSVDSAYSGEQVIPVNAEIIEQA